ncbi:hypothetical protein [Sphingomonas sp. BAUL-RG-20F-R05-02]|uniref:hypothetical protein n=1 Tax=Sphingomonas sp. BAUL-RG-20F-R05-02 TaxID=2914830 RepID=UPI001F55FF74|nr:hypothetical protein [Sphingomonas sp. BAUL-RG-20F-R05-02]
MRQRDHLIAYLATLATLTLIFTIAIVAGVISEHVIGKIEAFGLGTITGGLIGVLRLPTSQSAEASGGSARSSD